MDVDPLADTVPPRHLYESDSEDEWDPLPSTSSSARPSTSSTYNIQSDVAPAHKQEDTPALIVAFGEAARAWAPGAGLGAQVGSVRADGVEIALLFHPAWLRGPARMYVLTVHTPLPIGAQHAFAEGVLRLLKPERLALLDTYAVPAYISTEHIPIWDAPVRYLGVNSPPPAVAHIEPFAAPNLLQSTSAAFLSVSALPDPILTSNATLLLLPSPHIAPPPPPSLTASLSHTRADAAEDSVWDAETLSEVTHALLHAVGGDVKVVHWAPTEGKEGKGGGVKGRRRGDVGDGGMYI